MVGMMQSVAHANCALGMLQVDDTIHISKEPVLRNRFFVSFCGSRTLSLHLSPACPQTVRWLQLEMFGG